MQYLTAFIFLLFVNSAFCASEADLRKYEKGIWSIKGTSEKKMWIVVHNLKEAKETGIYHIEVLARGLHDPAWKVEHVIKHMAITQSALASGVKKPLNKGAVYPETFDTAYNDWQKQNSGRGGFICTSRLSDCMQQILHNNANPVEEKKRAAD